MATAKSGNASLHKMGCGASNMTGESPEHSSQSSTQKARNLVKNDNIDSSLVASLSDCTLRQDTVPALSAPQAVPPHTTWRHADVTSHTQSTDGTSWWDAAKLLASPDQTVINRELNRRGWKTIRLFVSSTFKDLHSEREFLVKRVFPQLRQWCEARRLRLIECDLRWGIPKDADTRQTLLTCLSEIDRCYEENEFPYFLALLSERYGWVPSPSEVPSDIIHRYKWIPGMSVTTLEVMTGGYWPKNPNALYMLRDPQSINEITRPDVLKYYHEDDENTKASLQKLKDCVDHLPDKQGTVHTYSCKLNGFVGNRAELTGLEGFGEVVMGHFKAAIEWQYPAQSLGSEMTAEEEQHLQHEAFMTQRSSLLLGRDSLLKDLESYMDGDSPVPMILIGFPGAGKSAVMATVARRSLEKNNYHVFYHFVGATPGSTNLLLLLRRLWKELMPSQDQVPADPEELKRSMAVVLETFRGRLEGNKKLIIIIDALNQLDNEGNEHLMTWLPRVLPPGVRVIVSTLEGACLETLRRSDVSTTKLPELVVAPLGKEIRQEIVKKILSEYNKKLDSSQMSILLKKEDAGRPLYLSIACEELRVFGEFRKLTQKITDLAPDLTNLLVQVLDRIIAENGGELVLNTLCLIEVSRFGLLENELLQLLASYSKMAETTELDKLPMAEWALVYLGLRPFLRPTGQSGEGRLDFYHRTISKAVRSKYLDAQNKTFWNKKLIDYFRKSTDLERRTEELPYQLIAYGDREGLKSVLVEMSTFERLYTNKSKQSLLSYWVQAGGYNVAGDLTVEAHHKYINNQSDLAEEEKIRIYSRLISFLTDIGQYKHAEAVSAMTLAMGDSNSKALCEPLFSSVVLYYLQALKVVYSSDPEYGRCVKMGRSIVKSCADLHIKHYASDDIHLGRVLTKCGYFNHVYLDQARAICETRSPQDYAEILYMFGEKNQYNADMGVPLGLFEKSLKLCLSHFGMFHLNTARCYQLYGQLYWNNNQNNEHMEDCLNLYKKELEILSELLGANHPTTLRSREDVMIILETLGRYQEAKHYK